VKFNQGKALEKVAENMVVFYRSLKPM